MSDIIVETNKNEVVIEMSGAGPRGEKGDAGSTEINLNTNSTIGGNRAISVLDGFAIYADSDLYLHTVGISTTATSSGEECIVQTSGKMIITSAGFTINELVYLSTNGTLTQTEPEYGISQVLGIAYDTDVLLIDIQRPIKRS